MGKIYEFVNIHLRYDCAAFQMYVLTHFDLIKVMSPVFCVTPLIQSMANMFFFFFPPELCLQMYIQDIIYNMLTYRNHQPPCGTRTLPCKAMAHSPKSVTTDRSCIGSLTDHFKAG